MHVKDAEWIPVAGLSVRPGMGWLVLFLLLVVCLNICSNWAAAVEAVVTALGKWGFIGSK